MTPISVLDDDMASRAALTRLLTQHGYKIRTAGDGSEGLCVWSSPCPMCSCVDIYLSERDEIETIHYVCQAFPQGPIIAMSGRRGATRKAGDVFTARDFGAQDLFTKPFTSMASSRMNGLMWNDILSCG